MRSPSGAVINVNVIEASRRMTQAHPTRARRHRPLSSSEPQNRPSAEFASHEAYRFTENLYPPDILMQGRKFYYFIIITIIVPLEHDSVTRRQNALGDSLARRLTRPRRVRPCRVHRRCSRSSIPDALCDYPAGAKAGGCIGCRVARPLG